MLEDAVAGGFRNLDFILFSGQVSIMRYFIRDYAM